MLKPLFLSVLGAALPLVALADPMVMGAASTRAALDDSIAQSGIAAVTSYGASGVLARQIEQGAPADLFISANPKWMTHLVEAGIVRPEDVAVLMSNTLVLIAREGAAPLEPSGIAARVAGDNFAMADPEVAPVGVYGREAMETLGLWGDVESHFVPTRNTTATVAAVAQGEAALGLVYGSDAAGQSGVTVVWEIPAGSHRPIQYLAAPVGQGDDADGARALLGFLQGPDGARILTRHGFVPVAGGS
ncbi:molybdate ABC transporter substrate-binding protein [Salipiger thiooxidans]|uniref:molybdate ABC transporter substrate-binding protein n=1 Tax=Salipiger thiooxidans TaxID=282683 RepID=UPI001CD8010E|nr:molybdate ABC transporter substrate-binding protein [Salipiger thiooxidans]MCA0850460.1 molybdate ABC transporter substrate-binding protein [Salipiger thiooxidans]